MKNHKKVSNSCVSEGVPQKGISQNNRSASFGLVCSKSCLLCMQDNGIRIGNKGVTATFEVVILANSRKHDEIWHLDVGCVYVISLLIKVRECCQ